MATPPTAHNPESAPESDGTHNDVATSETAPLAAQQSETLPIGADHSEAAATYDATREFPAGPGYAPSPPFATPVAVPMTDSLSHPRVGAPRNRRPLTPVVIVAASVAALLLLAGVFAGGFAAGRFTGHGESGFRNEAGPLDRDGRGPGFDGHRGNRGPRPDDNRRVRPGDQAPAGPLGYDQRAPGIPAPSPSTEG